MHVLVTGASGMIGRALVPRLQQAGHRVTALGRAPAGGVARVWEPEAGKINAVAPGVVDSGAFARALGRALRRPAVLPVPSWPLRLLYGQMARETLLADLRVRPGRLLDLGHRFLFPALEPALRHLLREH